jgi:hypothetical protein
MWRQIYEWRPTLMQRYRPRIFQTPTRRQRVLEDHQRLAEAILSGDEAAAHAAMLEHAPVGTTGFSEFLSTLPASYLDRSSIATPRLRRREALFLIEESAHQGAFDAIIL